MRTHRSLKRPAPTRNSKSKFIIYSEGKNTEPDYFKTVAKSLFGALVDLEIIEAAGVPLTIATKASERAKALSRRGKRRSSFEEGDQVWAIFDRDEHPSVPDALQRCRDAQVGIGFSDPCFELWLILHHEPFDKVDDRHQVQSALEKICTDYDSKKRKTTDCNKLMPFVEDAEVRAERQLLRRTEESPTPKRPFTTVYELTREMRKAHKKYQKNNK